jgi:hypothetical protein
MLSVAVTAKSGLWNATPEEMGIANAIGLSALMFFYFL